VQAVVDAIPQRVGLRRAQRTGEVTQHHPQEHVLLPRSQTHPLPGRVRQIRVRRLRQHRDLLDHVGVGPEQDTHAVAQ